MVRSASNLNSEFCIGHDGHRYLIIMHRRRFESQKPMYIKFFLFDNGDCQCFQNITTILLGLTYYAKVLFNCRNAVTSSAVNRSNMVNSWDMIFMLHFYSVAYRHIRSIRQLPAPSFQYSIGLTDSVSACFSSHWNPHTDAASKLLMVSIPLLSPAKITPQNYCSYCPIKMKQLGATGELPLLIWRGHSFQYKLPLQATQVSNSRSDRFKSEAKLLRISAGNLWNVLTCLCRC